ncbi:MAG: hypothetical protein PVJ01_03685 [Pseudomonadota bacterium]|jgi:hypothetical protein
MKNRIFKSFCLVFLSGALAATCGNGSSGGFGGADFLCGTNGVDNSCTPSGLSSLLASAENGDVIAIARGTHTWSSPVTVGKRVMITGGGSCPDCGEEDPTGTWSWPATLVTDKNAAFIINGPDGSNPDFVRISGLFIDGDPPDHSYSDGANTGSIVMHTNNAMHYRIDNVRFRPSGNSEQSSIRTNSDVGFGVIDHVYISTSGLATNGRFIHNTGHGGDSGDTDWSRPVDWNSGDFHFIEDTTMVFPTYTSGIPAGINDQQGGGRIVIRHSWLEEGNAGNHGTESGWPARSGVAEAFYNNTFISRGDIFSAVFLRGGGLYFHDNIVEGYQEGIRMWINRLGVSFGCGLCGDPACDGIDGDGEPAGWRCIDQPGAGVAAGVGIDNTQPQSSNPIRIWNNTLVNTGTLINNTSSSHIKENIDYFWSEDNSAAPAGYKPYQYPHPYTLID